MLSSCVRCAAGCNLSNQNVIDIFNACFRIGHYQTERSKDMSGMACLASPYARNVNLLDTSQSAICEP